jgi:rhamnosyltransferase
MTTPLVSIVVPTFNGAATLPALLEAVRAQRTDFGFELVAIDSGSTDGTLALLEAAADRVLRIPPGTFDHGATRNQAIAAGGGEFAALLVQDAVPASPDWLSRLVAPLRDDPGLAGAYARQIPRPDASPLTRHYLAGWAATGTTPRVATLAGPAELESLSPLDRYLRCVFDNVSSVVRRSVWERHPFPATPIAEDAEWARNVLLAGHRLAYVPEAAVVHSHERSARYELWRTYLVHQRLRALFGLRLVPTPLHLLAAVARSAASHLRCVAGEGPLVSRQGARAVALAVAFPLGQYLGALSADTGWRLLRPRGV